MSWAALPTPTRSSDHGEVRFVGPEVLREFLAAAEDDGFLTVALTPPGPAQRGRLGLVIEDAIETALQRRGACPPGVGASTTLDASLSDQLYRARLIELRGVAVAMPTLEGIANLAGALDAEDSAVLRWWIGATAERPVRVYFEAADRYLGVYGPPLPFHRLLSDARTTALVSNEPTPELDPEVAASSAAMELSDLPPAVHTVEPEPEPELEAELGATSDIDHAAPAQFANATEASDELPEQVYEAEPSSVDESHDDGLRSELENELDAALRAELEASETETPALAQHEDFAAANEATEVPEALELSSLVQGSTEPTEAEPVEAEPVETTSGKADALEADPIIEESLREALRESGSKPQEEPLPPLEPEPILAALSEESATTALPPVEAKKYAPLYPNAAEEWRGWVHELEGVRGPKPLAIVERMFVTSYVPLSDAVARGIGGADAQRALDSWGSSFEQSYKEAFDALRMRGKRPTMVLDVPDLALRIGRLHGARSVQLVVVDGMRFDLGLRIEQRLRKGLGQGVALTERLLLWSALPSTTDVQLELIGRGPEALRTFTGEVNSEVPVARGRNAATLRRIRAGQRELFKLDLIEAALSEPGGPEAERLDDLADEASASLMNYFQRLPARTLVMVFGDHGFLLDPLDTGTTAARHGGASPEEVLVPAFAWLVGGVH